MWTTLMRIQPLLVAAFLVIAGSPDLGATDIPGNASTRATLTVEVANYAFTIGEFERPGDRDWYRVSLSKGKHYFVAVNGNSSTCAVGGFVRNAAGKVLKSGTSDLFIDEGFEFLAPYTGTFFVEYRPLPLTCFSDFGAHFNHFVRVSADCAGSPETSCLHAVGQARKSMLAGALDRDFFKVVLSKAKTYTLKAVPTNSPFLFTIGIANSTGRVRAQDQDDDSDGVNLIQGFRPTANGNHFLFVHAGDDFGTVYSLSLKTP